MTLLDAILATLGGFWAFLSAPLTVVACGIVLVFTGAIAFVSGFRPEDYKGEFPIWGRAIFWLIGLAIFLLGIAMFVWISGTHSPFTWSKP